MKTHVLIATLAAALAAALPAPAQTDDDGSSIYVEVDDAKPLLDQAKVAEAKGQWDVAVEKYARVLKEHPDNMALMVGADGKTWGSVRRYVFLQISKFPAAGLAAYSSANDAVAKSLYEQAVKDGTGLERIVNEYFFTTVGDDAAARLADACAEQGRLQDAAYYWELAAKVYPKSDLSMATLYAKWGAACRKSGDDAGWAVAKKGLADLGDAPLMMGGERITAKDAVAKLQAIAPAKVRLEKGSDWPRPGGNNSATRVTDGVTKNEVRLWTWPKLTDEQIQQKLTQSRQVWRGMAMQGPFLQLYPAVGPAGEVVVADGSACWALAMDGPDQNRELWRYPDTAKSEDMFAPALQDQPRVMSLVAPVIDHGVVYVNFLPRAVNRGVANEGTSLAAIKMGAANSKDAGTLLWTTAKNPDLDKLWFGSPPVVYGERVYAAVASAENQTSPEVELLILDARDGQLIKRIFLCQGRRGQNNWAGMVITEAPTIAESGGVLYINTNLGGVAAVQSATGEVLWLTEYLDGEEKQNPNRAMRQLTDRNGRGLSPIVILGNRVCFVAGDSQSYLEYDARTGKRILAVPAILERENKSDQNTIRWFCGIVDEKAWFQTTSKAFVINLSDVNFHHWYRRLPGRELKPDPAMARLLTLTLGENTRVLGKGFLTTDKFYLGLDTALNSYDIHTFKLSATQRWQDNTKKTDTGTAVVVGTRLLTLCDAGVTCFTDRATFDKGYEEVLASATPDLVKLEEHACVLARNPATVEGAITDYKRIAALAATSNPPLAVRARTRTMELYRAMGDADMKASEPRYAAAISHYRQAVEAAPAEVALGDVFQVMGDCYERLSQWKEAVAVYQEVIEKYGERMLTTDPGLVEPVRRFAQEKIQRLVKEHGAELYGEIEKKAKEALDKLKEKASPEELRKWLENFPNSALGATAAGLLADQLEAAGKPSEAGLILLQASAFPGAGTSAAPFVVRAGKLFASVQAWERLEGAAGRLERCHGAETVSLDGKELNAVAAAAALRALRPPQPTPGATEGPQPWREWRVDAVDVTRVAKSEAAHDAGPTLLAASGAWTGLDPKKVFFVQRAAVLEARDAETDKAIWSSIDPRGYFGVVISDGVSFSDVKKDLPADRAGIQKDDALIEWNGEPVRSEDHLRRLICGAGGKTVNVVVRRKGDRVPLQVTVGKRDADSEPAEPAESLVFTDGGLLLIVRPSSVQAVRPATGETAWVHCPVYPKVAHVTRAVSADGRVFLAWAPSPTAVVNPQQPPPEKDVSIEALDAADGRVLWQYRESNCDVLDLMAAPGTGTVVKAERRGVGGHLRILDAANGTEKRSELTALLLPGAARLAAGLDGGRLVYLAESNVLGSYDLFAGIETRRDLKGQKAPPDAFVPEGGHAVLAYSSTRRVLFVGPDPASECLIATLPDGIPEPEGVGIAGDLVVVTTRAGAGSDTKGMLRWYSTTGGELKVKWQAELGTQGTPMGLVHCGSDAISIWVGAWRTDRGAAVLPIVQGFSPAKLRAAWDIELAEDAAAGPLVGAGQQGGTIWVQYDDKLLLYR